MTQIVVVNESTVLTDADVQHAVVALSTQVGRDWAPAWGSGATVSFMPKSQQPGATDWVLGILDDSDQAGALGYHDVTDTGMPLGKAFAKIDMAHNLSWTVTISHELLEMLGDPDINLTMLDQLDTRHAALYAYEVCDAVEDDQFGYMIGDVRVSDFVYPAYFQTFQPTSARFDHVGHLHAPVPHMLTGGYMSVLNLHDGKGWTQIYGDIASHDRGRLPRAIHRRMMRRMPRHDRRRSHRWTTT